MGALIDRTQCPYCGGNPATAIQGQHYPVPVPAHRDCVKRGLQESREEILGHAGMKCAYAGIDVAFDGGGEYTEDVEFFGHTIHVGVNDGEDLKEACRVLEHTVLTAAHTGAPA